MSGSYRGRLACGLLADELQRNVALVNVLTTFTPNVLTHFHANQSGASAEERSALLVRLRTKFAVVEHRAVRGIPNGVPPRFLLRSELMPYRMLSSSTGADIRCRCSEGSVCEFHPDYPDPCPCGGGRAPCLNQECRYGRKHLARLQRASTRKQVAPTTSG
jgi:hypothetical protein